MKKFLLPLAFGFHFLGYYQAAQSCIYICFQGNIPCKKFDDYSVRDCQDYQRSNPGLIKSCSPCTSIAIISRNGHDLEIIYEATVPRKLKVKVDNNAPLDLHTFTDLPIGTFRIQDVFNATNGIFELSLFRSSQNLQDSGSAFQIHTFDLDDYLPSTFTLKAHDLKSLTDISLPVLWDDGEVSDNTFLDLLDSEKYSLDILPTIAYNGYQVTVESRQGGYYLRYAGSRYKLNSKRIKEVESQITGWRLDIDLNKEGNAVVFSYNKFTTEFKDLEGLSDEEVMAKFLAKGEVLAEISFPITQYFESKSLTQSQYTANGTLEVYPNPASVETNILWSKPLESNGVLTIMDQSGKVISQTDLTKGSTQYILNTVTLASGTYLAVVRDGTTHLTSRLTITK